MNKRDESELDRLRTVKDDLRKQLDVYREKFEYIECIAGDLCSICPYDFRRAILELIDEARTEIKEKLGDHHKGITG